MDSQTLLDELKMHTRRNLEDIASFQKLPDDALNYKVSPEAWSILECVEHLNRYGTFYLPEIRQRLERATFPKSAIFRSGLLGGYFCRLIQPGETIKKMQTAPAMNPINSKLDRRVLDTFVHQQEELLMLFDQAANTDLTRIQTAITLARWIKLRLGDTLRFVVYHNNRHLSQAKRVLGAIPETGNPITQNANPA